MQDGEFAVIGTRLDGTIIFWNPAAEKLYGHRAEEVLGSRVDVLYAPADLSFGLPAALVDATLRRGRWHGFSRRLRRDGKSVLTRTLMVPIVVDDEVENIFEVSIVGHNGKPMALLPALSAVKSAFPVTLHRPPAASTSGRRRGRDGAAVRARARAKAP